LAALAASAAATLVNAMVTEVWEQTKPRVVRLFGRRGRSGEPAEDRARGALEETRERLAAARAAGDEGAVARIENELLREVGRLLEEQPEVARELRGLLTELGAERVPGPAAITGGIQYGAVQNSHIHGDVTYHVSAPPSPSQPQETVPDEVPALRTKFRNRTAELARMDGMLAGAGAGGPANAGTDADTADSDESGDTADGPPHVDVLVLGGTPGVGKTATATRWAHRSRERFPDGQLYVDFAELRGRRGGADVSAAMETCLRSMGVKDAYVPHALADQTRLFRSQSAGRRMLLVLDDVNEAAQVRALVPQGPGSAVLVTSNGKLGELAVDGATLLSLDPLDTGSALAILADRCGEAAVAEDPEAAERLVELCGGLPVALHMVASRLLRSRRLTPARLVRELSDEAGRLEGMSLGGEASVSVVFDSVYRRLAADEARFYRLLGWLPCRTFAPGAAAVATATDARTAQSLLDALEEAGMLAVTEGDRYRMHDLVRLHARERAGEEEPPGAQLAVVERLITHYLALTAFADRAVREKRLRVADLDDLLRRAENPFASADAPAPLEWLEQERTSILAVLRAAYDLGLHALVWQLAEAFTVLFLHRRHVQDWKESLELGVAAASECGEPVPAAEARLRSLLSRPLLDLGEYERARVQLEAAVACAEAAGRAELRASVLEFYGRYWDRVDPSRAIAAYERSVELNAEAGEERGAAIATLFLGSAQDAAGDSRRALATLRRAHDALLAGAEPDLRMAARAAAAVGRAQARLGDTEQAARTLSEAAEALRAQQATHYEAEALLELAALAEQRGEPARMREHLARALEIHEDGGSPLAGELRDRLRRADRELGT